MGNVAKPITAEINVKAKRIMQMTRWRSRYGLNRWDGHEEISTKGYIVQVFGEINLAGKGGGYCHI
jgi:hypothetical protein